MLIAKSIEGSAPRSKSKFKDIGHYSTVVMVSLSSSVPNYTVLQIPVRRKRAYCLIWTYLRIGPRSTAICALRFWVTIVFLNAGLSMRMQHGCMCSLMTLPQSVAAEELLNRLQREPLASWLAVKSSWQELHEAMQGGSAPRTRFG